MAKNDIGGVWRTVGGRRIFIKDGQDLASAMKESGKFKTTAKANEDKTKREAEFEKNIDEMYNRFHGKTDEQIANEIAKERGERILTDEEQKAREVQFMKDLENAVQTRKDISQGKTEPVEKLKVENANRTPEESKKYKTRDEMEARAKEAGKSTLINEYNKNDSKGSMSDDAFIEQARKAGMSDENIAKEVYKKHNGPESNNTSDNNIKRLLAKQAKEEATASGNKQKAEMFERYEKRFEERIKASETIQENKNKYSVEYENYKKAHPNTDLTLNDYIKVKQGGVGGTPIKTSESSKETKQDALSKETKGYRHLNENNLGKGYEIEKVTDSGTYQVNYGNDEKKLLIHQDNTGYYVRNGGKKEYFDSNMNQKLEKQGVKGINDLKSSNKENKTGKTNNSSNDWVRNAFNDYKKEHPNTKMTLEQFKKSKK